MKKHLLLISFIAITASLLTGCALFQRHDELAVRDTTPDPLDKGPKRTTRKSMEEESLLGESTGSLWVGRGQASYLFTNNTQRLLGDLLNVNVDGYPKEQIQTKVAVIAKLLSEILNEQKQEIQLKQQELKKKIEQVPQEEQNDQPVIQRALASESESGQPVSQDPKDLLNQNEKALQKIGSEEKDIANLQKAQDFPIRSVPTRIVEIQKDGNYMIKGEQPFMIGKREYKLLVMGIVRHEDFEEKGISAEKLMNPTFDVISEHKSEAL